MFNNTKCFSATRLFNKDNIKIRNACNSDDAGDIDFKIGVDEIVNIDYNIFVNFNILFKRK